MTHFHQKDTLHFTSVTLLVKDLPRAIEFYKDILGFNVIYKEKSKIGFGANLTNTIIHLIEDRNAIDQGITQGLYHYALLLPNRMELAKIIRQLRDNRYPITGASDHGVSEAIYLDDPDGNGIEIYVDKAETEWPMVNDRLSMVTLPLNIESLMKNDDGTTYLQVNSSTILGHIHLHVDDLDLASTFYSTAIGFKKTQNYMDSALFFSDKGYHHHIGLNSWHKGAPLNQIKQVGLKRLTLNIPKLEYIGFSRRLADLHIPLLIDQDQNYLIDAVGIKIYLEIEKG